MKVKKNNLFHLSFVVVISLPHKSAIRGVFPANHLAKVLTTKPKQPTHINI